MHDMPPLVPIPDNLKIAPLRIDYYGPSSVVYVKGVGIGMGVERVVFEHEAGKPARLSLDCNADKLQFLIPEMKESAPDGASSGTDWATP